MFLALEFPAVPSNVVAWFQGEAIIVRNQSGSVTVRIA